MMAIIGGWRERNCFFLPIGTPCHFWTGITFSARNNASLTDGHKCCYSEETRVCMSFEDLGNVLIQGMSELKLQPDFLHSCKSVKVYKWEAEFLFYSPDIRLLKDPVLDSVRSESAWIASQGWLF